MLLLATTINVVRFLIIVIRENLNYFSFIQKLSKYLPDD